MLMAYCILVFITSLVKFSYADYECLCNYHTETGVYPTTNKQAAPIGYLYEFDCKPTYLSSSAAQGWQEIHFEKQMGYVFLDDQLTVQTCPGSPDTADLVPSTTTSSSAATRYNTTPLTTVPSTKTTLLSIPTSAPSTATTNSTRISQQQSTQSSQSVPVTVKKTTSIRTMPITKMTTLLPTTTRGLQCPPGVPRSTYLKEYGQHCYEFVLGRSERWPDAENDCKRKSGHLVAIGSFGEQQFVYNSVRLLHYHRDSHVWIGLTDSQNENHWQWSSGERVGFTYWQSGQPSGFFEDCAIMEMRLHGRWGDYPCNGFLFSSEKHGWVCEYHKV